jgi:hypothetical protein
MFYGELVTSEALAERIAFGLKAFRIQHATVLDRKISARETTRNLMFEDIQSLEKRVLARFQIGLLQQFQHGSISRPWRCGSAKAKHFQ